MLGWGFTGEAPAEHGSALRTLPYAIGEGEGWGGGFALLIHQLRGLRRSHW